MRIITKLAFILVFTLTLVGAKQAHAIVLIDEITDSFTAGDFTVLGNNRGGGIGTAFELLKFNTGPRADSASDGVSPDTAPNGDLSIADIQNVLLNDFGITSTNIFVFGLDVNENNGSPIVQIDELVLTIDGTSYDLGTEVVRASQDTTGNPGSSIAEVLFEVDLGFDFMTLTSTGPGDFTLFAKHSNEVAGPEEYFIDEAFFTPPNTVVPEPATMLLLGSGLGMACLRRRKKS